MKGGFRPEADISIIWEEAPHAIASHEAKVGSRLLDVTAIESVFFVIELTVSSSWLRLMCQ